MHGRSHERDLADLILSVEWRRSALAAVAALNLPDCWICAGFVRAPVWDRLHGYSAASPLDDIDVIYFDPACLDPAVEAALEARLAAEGPQLPWPRTRWEVTNQARMHLKKGDAPYASTEDSLRHWLEVPTAVGARLAANGEIEILAPFGLDDLFALALRPTPYACAHQPQAYRERVERKGWVETWPKLRLHLP